MAKILVWLMMVGLMSGCATVMERQSSAEVKVNKGVPVVLIHPLEAETYAHATVVVLPFLLPEAMERSMGSRIAALYQDVLLGKAVFPVVKLASSPYGDFSEAVAAGRAAGADLVLVGKVNYALEGTELGGTRLDVTVRLINIATGTTVWHLNQTMDQPYAYPKADLVSRVSGAMSPPPIKRPQGAPVMTNMLAQVAVDMADVLVGARLVRR